jgi:hypothetical protein
MRSKRTLGVISTLALAVAVSVAGVATAGSDTENGVTQSMEATVKPNKKLPKKKTKNTKPKGVDMNVSVGITAPPGQKPPGAEQVDIDFDKDLFFTTKGLATCDENAIAQANTEAARQACKKAQVGIGSAAATCSGNPTPDIPDVTVTAFNGKPKGKTPVLLLHTYTLLGGTDTITILPGKLINASGKDFGKRLRVDVPPLAGGACSIVDFETTVGKRFKSKGKKFDYVGAVCSHKEWHFDSEFRFVQPNEFGVSSLSPTHEQKCKAKK